jgi:general secretion pathway protein J
MNALPGRDHRCIVRCVRCDAGRDAGFTLIEVIVGLALAGLVSLIMMHGIGLAALGLDRLSQHAERLDERRGLEMLIRRALSTAVATPVADGEPSFVGKATSVSFLSVVEDGGPGLYRVKLAFDTIHPAGAVTLTRRLAAASAASRRDESVLVHRARRFDISYFGATSPAEKPTWHRDWTGIAYLPQLVRIILETDDGREQLPVILRLRNAG